MSTDISFDLINFSLMYIEFVLLSINYYADNVLITYSSVLIAAVLIVFNLLTIRRRKEYVKISRRTMALVLSFIILMVITSNVVKHIMH